MVYIKNVIAMCRIKFFIMLSLMFTAFSSAAQESQQLHGTPIGSWPTDYGSGPQSLDYAFDDNPDTYYASQDRSNTWVGLDLGTPHVITKVGWMSRKGYASRVELGLFEGSNREDFLDAIPLYIIPEGGVDGQLLTHSCPVSRGFRYVRYVGPHDVRCNIAEVAFFGYEGVGDSTSYYQISDIPTLSIHIYDGSDPSWDKLLERECNMTLTYDHGTRIQEYPMTIRGRGNASWGFDKKPYRIKFNDGKKHHMLKDSKRESPAKAKKWTLLSNEGDKTLMRNLLAHEVSRELEMPYTVFSEPVDVILNGEYKGLYNLCDQVDENKDRIPITEMETTDDQEPELTGGYHIEIDNYANGEPAWFNSKRGTPVTIKSPDGDEITANQRRYIQDFFNQMESEVWTNYYDDPATGYMKHLDINSFLRFFLLGEMSGNTDTYYSIHMWKERGEDMFYTSPGWDFDLAFENDSRTYPICNNNNWIFASKGSCTGDMRQMVNRIINGPNGEKMLKQIWADARKSGRLTEEKLVGFLDSLEQLMTPSANLNFKRWPILNQKRHMNFQALGRYDLEVNVARQYIIQRIVWMDEKLKYSQEKVYNDTTMYISTPAQLVEFADHVNNGGSGSVAHLQKDLDMSGVIMPSIGTGRRPFHGEFNGQGHVIDNLQIHGTNDVGLFGSINGTAYIHDFIMGPGSRVSGVNYVGLVGCTQEDASRLTIERVGNEAYVEGDFNVGSLLGCNKNSAANIIIRDCYNTGFISGQRESGALSGWMGSSYTIERCWNCGEATGYENPEHMLYRFSGNNRGQLVFSTVGKQGSIISEQALSTGELAWRLNGESADTPIWYQRIGSDPHPVFDFSHGIVYKEADGTYSNGKFLLGDANADGVVNATDMALIADYSLGRNAEGIDLTNADANGDDVINILDIMQTGGIIRQGALIPEKNAESPSSITASDATIKAAVTKRYSTMIQGALPQAVFQTDVILPEGISMDLTTLGRGTALTTNHQLLVEAIEGGMRIIAYAPDMTAFTSQTSTAFVLKLVADADFREGDIILANQLLSTANGVVSRPQDIAYRLTFTPTPVTSITPSQKVYEFTLGESLPATIEVTVLPETATDKSVTYATSDASIVEVDETGLLTPQSAGTATITIEAADGSKVKATVSVTVLPDPTGIEDIQGNASEQTIYDLGGIRLSQMQRGRVYIIGKKKVIIK